MRKFELWMTGKRKMECMNCRQNEKKHSNKNESNWNDCMELFIAFHPSLNIFPFCILNRNVLVFIQCSVPFFILWLFVILNSSFVEFEVFFYVFCLFELQKADLSTKHAFINYSYRGTLLFSSRRIFHFILLNIIGESLSFSLRVKNM